MTKTEAPNCARCSKVVEITQEYELLADQYIHKTCYEEACLAIVLTAPTLEEVQQMKAMRKMMANMNPGNMMNMMMSGKMLESDTLDKAKDSSS